MKNLFYIILTIIVAYILYLLYNKFFETKPDAKKIELNSETGNEKIGSFLSVDKVFYFRKSDCTLFVDADQSKASLMNALSGYESSNYASKYNSENHSSWRRVFELHPKKQNLGCLCKCNTTKQIDKLLEINAVENLDII